AAVNVNLRDSFGNVPLHFAVDSGSETIVKLLLDHGAEIDA
ncbi:ankyrin repeat domain-containing protein, partial [Candidatus Bathyarchaeota archaeon]|nr:ankyrin repeat domain-containing protein [Candidatus Bathyarchaeota archaeon]